METGVQIKETKNKCDKKDNINIIIETKSQRFFNQFKYSHLYDIYKIYTVNIKIQLESKKLKNRKHEKAYVIIVLEKVDLKPNST